MSSGALHWTDQQAPRPRSRSRFQQADYSQQYQSLQQDQHRRAPLPGQRNSGSHLQHLPQYGDTNRSRERPQSEDDPAQYVDPFGLRYHDSSRYSGIGTSSGTGTPSRPRAALKFPLYHETFAAKEKALKAAEEERLREAAKAMKGLKKKRKDDGQVPPNFYINAPRDASGAYLGNYSSNPWPHADNNNSSHNQPYASQSGLASPPQTSARNILGSYPDSGQHSHRSVPRHAVERDLPPPPPPPPREYRHEPRRTRPHSDFIPRDNRALQYLHGDQGVHGRRNTGPSSMFASVPPRGIHPDTHLNHRWPAEPRQGHQPMAEDDSDVEYETITAEEACQIRQDDIYAKLPKAFRRTTSDGKLKKQTIALKGPGSSLCEPRPSALETYRLSSGNGNGFAPGGFQGFLPRKLRRW